MIRISRRQFIATSVVTGCAGIVRRHGAFTHGVEAPSNRHVSLSASGNARDGYQAVIRFDGRPVARHTGQGEWSALFHNSDHSIEDRMENWRATSCTGNEGQLLLRGNCKLANLKATILAEVEYRVVTSQVVRKEIRFHQVDMYQLLYQITNSLE